MEAEDTKSFEHKLPPKGTDDSIFNESGWNEPITEPSWEDVKPKSDFVLRDNEDFYGTGKPWLWRAA